MIVAVFGLPGSGKSYFARTLSERLGARYVSSDRIRKELFPEPDYSLEEKTRVYKEMFDMMYDFLNRRQPLVLDATFFRKELREHFDREASSLGCRIAWIEVRASDRIIRDRLSKSREESDADYTVHQLIRSSFQPMRKPHLVLDSTDDNIEQMINVSLDYLKTFRPSKEIRKHHSFKSKDHELQ